MAEARISSHIKCPHCGRVSEKSEPMKLFAGATGVGFAGSSEMPCPFCRRGINTMGILNGEYDHWESAGAAVWIFYIVLAIGLIWLVLAVTQG